MLCVTWGKRKAAPMIDAVVVLVVAVIALAGCGNVSERQSEISPPDPGQTKPSAAQAVPDTSIALAPVDREVYELTGFLSPSGNVGCKIAPAGVGCNILERDWSPPPRPADCRWDYERIVVGPGEPTHFVCAGDSVHNSADPPLAYGEAITAGSMRCESAQSGITCRDVESGHGFSISREAYQLF
jgi:hypothetical protein